MQNTWGTSDAVDFIGESLSNEFSFTLRCACWILPTVVFFRHRRTRRNVCSSGKQFLNLIPVQRLSKLLFTQRGFDDVALLLLKRENLFLHSSTCDEFVARYDARLSNAMRAIRGLVLDRGIPPRIEMNDRVRAGEVQSHAAGLEADEKNRRGTALKFLHDIATVCCGAIEVAEVNFLLVQLLLEQRQHADELAEDEHAMSTVRDFLEQFIECFEFAGWVSQRRRRLRRLPRNGRNVFLFAAFVSFARQIQQPQVAANLPQPQQRGENNEATLGQPLRAHGLQNFLAAEFHHLLVNGALLLVQLAECDLFDLGRKIGGHVALESAQNEWFEPSREPSLSFSILLSRDRNFVALLEILRAAEVTGHEKVEDAPEIEHGIFQRRAREYKPVL